MIENKIISEEIFKERFVCDLNACQGSCCWEGDYGAPLELEELDTLEAIYEDVKPFLTPEGIAAIEKEGPAVYHTRRTRFCNNLS